MSWELVALIIIAAALILLAASRPKRKPYRVLWREELEKRKRRELKWKKKRKRF